MTTLYRELRWVAKEICFSDGWAWYTFQEIMSRKPTAPEKKGYPLRPSKETQGMMEEHLKPFHRARMLKALGRVDEAGKVRKDARIQDMAWRELDAGRPRIDDL